MDNWLRNEILTALPSLTHIQLNALEEIFHKLIHIKLQQLALAKSMADTIPLDTSQSGKV